MNDAAADQSVITVLAIATPVIILCGLLLARFYQILNEEALDTVNVRETYEQLMSLLTSPPREVKHPVITTREQHGASQVRTVEFDRVTITCDWQTDASNIRTTCLTIKECPKHGWRFVLRGSTITACEKLIYGPLHRRIAVKISSIEDIRAILDLIAYMVKLP